ncbi:MAG: mechanosensitive ion channel family protein, partial [Alphaproteobacteria bacterium]|nr:mechanosensitive ion channel family protein [Alphaproteobacteria bacterium]
MNREQLEKFWETVKEVWNQGFLGADVGTVVVALGVFAIFLFFRHLFARFVINQLERLTRKTSSNIDDQVIEALDGPLRFVPVVAGLFFATETLELGPDYAEIAGKLLRSLIAFTIFWAIFRVLKPIST